MHKTISNKIVVASTSTKNKVLQTVTMKHAKRNQCNRLFLLVMQILAIGDSPWSEPMLDCKEDSKQEEGES